MLTHVFSPSVKRPSPTLHHRVRDFLEWLASIMGFGPFSRLKNQELADYHWAAQSGLLRAVRNNDIETIARLSPLVDAMEREMRRRRV